MHPSLNLTVRVRFAGCERNARQGALANLIMRSARSQVTLATTSDNKATYAESTRSNTSNLSSRLQNFQEIKNHTEHLHTCKRFVALQNDFPPLPVGDWPKQEYRLQDVQASIPWRPSSPTKNALINLSSVVFGSQAHQLKNQSTL